MLRFKRVDRRSQAVPDLTNLEFAHDGLTDYFPMTKFYRMSRFYYNNEFRVKWIRLWIMMLRFFIFSMFPTSLDYPSWTVIFPFNLNFNFWVEKRKGLIKSRQNSLLPLYHGKGKPETSFDHVTQKVRTQAKTLIPLIPCRKKVHFDPATQKFRT